MGRAALGGAAFGGLLGTSGAGAWYQLFKRPLPRTRGSVTVDGIAGPVEIRRDRWGVPHIRAGTRTDLWFGQGFCHAQDRLWQLELYRRTSGGRVAEIAGEEGLGVDRLVRTLGFRDAAEREEAELEPGLRTELDAYSAGVNAAVASLRALPSEFQILRIGFDPWRPADMLTAIKLLAFGLSTNWERELLRADMARELGTELTALLDPVYPRGNPVAVRPGRGFEGDGMALVEQLDRLKGELGLAIEASGSNNWAVCGERSSTGGALLAGDPHLPPSMPGIWYQVSLESGGRFARGASLPGTPGIFMGHNNDVGWTFTNTMADVQDLYVERLDGDRYEHDGEWHELETRVEEIAVRGREESELLEVRSTRHGPIVNGVLNADESDPLALRFAAVDMPGITSAQVTVLDATDGESLVASCAAHTLPVSNLVWADRHGGIGYKTIGRIPIRRGDCPDLPKPGWTSDYDWNGWVPYEEMPEVRDPDRGYLVTANNRIAPLDYPHHITSEYLDGYRARRIEQLIEDEAEHDLDGFAAMQTDNYSIPGLETAHRLARIKFTDQRMVHAAELLRSWDGRMEADSVPASIYQAFTIRFAREFAREVIRDRDLAERWLDRSVSAFTTHITSPWRWQTRLMELWEQGDAELLGREWDDLARDALRAALDDLADRFGRDPAGWSWGRVHRLNFPHALGGANKLLARMYNRSVEVGGAQETVSQIAFDPSEPFAAVWAPSWRMVIDMSDPEGARWQTFTGQSGHPGSRHYDELQERWQRGEMQPMKGEGPWRSLTLEPK